MGIIIDTCIFIQTEKSGQPIDFGRWLSYGHAYMSVVTASELLVGVHRANNEARKLRRSAFIEAILAGIPVLDFTLDIARIHAEICAYLAEIGQLIGAHDLIIAATAVAHGYALLTDNQAEFKRVPGIKLLDNY